MTGKLVRGRDSGRVVPSKPREPGAEVEPTNMGGQYADGIFDLVIRVVPGRVELIKTSLPALPPKKRPYTELKRVRLSIEHGRVPLTTFYKQFAKELAALQAKLDREAKQ